MDNNNQLFNTNRVTDFTVAVDGGVGISEDFYKEFTETWTCDGGLVSTKIPIALVGDIVTAHTLRKGSTIFTANRLATEIVTGNGMMCPAFADWHLSETNPGYVEFTNYDVFAWDQCDDLTKRKLSMALKSSRRYKTPNGELPEVRDQNLFLAPRMMTTRIAYEDIQEAIEDAVVGRSTVGAYYDRPRGFRKGVPIFGKLKTWEQDYVDFALVPYQPFARDDEVLASKGKRMGWAMIVRNPPFKKDRHKNEGSYGHDWFAAVENLMTNPIYSAPKGQKSTGSFSTKAIVGHITISDKDPGQLASDLYNVMFGKENVSNYVPHSACYIYYDDMELGDRTREYANDENFKRLADMYDMMALTKPFHSEDWLMTEYLSAVMRLGEEGLPPASGVLEAELLDSVDGAVPVPYRALTDIYDQTGCA